MVFSLDFLGFGSKRKWAFSVLDREWAAMDIDIRPVDGGVRQVLYNWVLEFAQSDDHTDALLKDAAAFTGFLMLGPELGTRPFGSEGVKAMQKRFEDALNAADTVSESDEPIDVKMVKLILAAGLADRDIEALASLDADD